MSGAPGAANSSTSRSGTPNRGRQLGSRRPQVVRRERTHARETRGRPPGRYDRYLLSGILRCGVCGNLYQGKQLVGRKRRYRCLSRLKGGATACPNTVTVLCDQVDEWIIGAVDDALAPDRVRKAVAEARKQDRGKRRTEPDKLRRELQAIEGRIRNLTEAAAAGRNIPSIVAALERDEQARAEIKARIDALKTDTPPTMGKVAALRRSLRDIAGEGNRAQIREVIRAVAREITVDPEGVVRAYLAPVGLPGYGVAVLRVHSR